MYTGDRAGASRGGLGVYPGVCYNKRGEGSACEAFEPRNLYSRLKIITTYGGEVGSYNKTGKAVIAGILRRPAGTVRYINTLMLYQ